jgi:hypothetical protein
VYVYFVYVCMYVCKSKKHVCKSIPGWSVMKPDDPVLSTRHQSSSTRRPASRSQEAEKMQLQQNFSIFTGVVSSVTSVLFRRGVPGLAGRIWLGVSLRASSRTFYSKKRQIWVKESINMTKMRSLSSVQWAWQHSVKRCGKCRLQTDRARSCVLILKDLKRCLRAWMRRLLNI